jgi:ceramide glucosyltransferase
LALAGAPLLYYCVATIAALRFFRRERRLKLPNFTPRVSLLKPVRGVDFGSYENFASFCRQDYPDYEILFGVNTENDPAIPLIRRVMAEFPERRIRVFIGAENNGANRKVSKQIRLLQHAENEIVVLTDGDVRVGPGFLREVIAPFAVDAGANGGVRANGKVGAVTSFYRSLAEPNLGAELEAIGASGDFFAGVLVAQWMEGMTFALGASIVTTKTWIEKIGGLEAIADMHSDDYELGHRIAKAGGTVVLACEAVWTMYPAQTMRGFWEHQLRWARTVRLCRPLSFAGLIFTHGLPWAIFAAAIAPARWIGAAYLCGYLALRLLTAWTVGVWGIGDNVLRRKMWLVPLRDAIHFVVWLASFASTRISWGGAEFTMEKGQIVPRQSEVPTRDSDRAAGVSK